jgi:Na+/melibiose symporter-like transporter
VRPISNAIYTARLALNYPSDLLNYESAVFSNGWIPLLLGEKSSFVDSASGLVVKTAGYPGGVPMEGTDFAVINFVAKKSGSGTISTNAGSVAMDKKGFDKYSGNLSQTNLLVHGNPVSVQVIASPEGAEQTETTQVVENQNDETKKDTRKSLLAGILGFFTSIPGYLMLIVLLALIIYWLYIKYFSSPEEEAERQFAAIVEREREDDK